VEGFGLFLQSIGFLKKKEKRKRKTKSAYLTNWTQGLSWWALLPVHKLLTAWLREDCFG